MKTSISTSLILLLMIIMGSCSPIGPHTFHVPQLNEKGDFQGAGYINMSTGVELQADYAWGNHLYSPADFSYSIVKSGQNGFRSNAYSLGIGYYTSMRTNGRFDLYYAPRYGNYGNTGSDYKSNFFTNTLGFDLGWRFRHFEAAFSMNAEKFSVFDNNWKANGNSTNLGAAMTMRFGGERTKFHMQMGLTYPIGEYSIDVFPYLFSLGVNYRLNLRQR